MERSADSLRPILVMQELIALARSGKLSQALCLAESLYERHGNDPGFLLVYGELCLQSEQWEKAESLLRACLERAPNHTQVLYAFALACQRQRKFEQAIASYDALLRVRSGHPAALNNLGVCLEHCGHYDRAAECFESLLLLQPTNAPVLNNLGNVRRKLGQLAKATAHYEKALNVNGPQSLLLKNLSITWQARGNLDRAIDFAERSLECGQATADLHNHVATLYVEAGNTEKAITHFRYALALNPHYLSAYNNLACALARIGQTNEAMGVLRQALLYAPHDRATLCNLASVLTGTTQASTLAEAEAIARALLEQDPNSAPALNCLAVAAHKTGRQDLALQCSERAMEIAPDNPEYGLTQATIVKSLGNDKLLEQLLDTLASKFPLQAEVLQQLGILQLYNGELETARISLARANALNPQDQRATAHLAIASAQLGYTDDFLRLVNFERFIFHKLLPSPANYADNQEFNGALAQEIRLHPNLQWEPGGLAAKNGFMAHGIESSPPEALRAFEELLRATIEEFIASLPTNPEHPFLSSIPETYVVHIWANVLKDNGYIGAHIHEGSWLSGAYYVELPPLSDDDKSGYLEFGPPHSGVPSDKIQSHYVKPSQGRLVLFPSYFFHRTVPFSGEFERISIAFDVTPTSYRQKATRRALV